MKKYITVDVGGTQIRVAVFSENSIEPLNQKKIKTQGDGQTPVERMSGLLEEMWPTEGEVISIAVAAPGYLEPKKGIVVSAPNIPGWNNLPLCEILSKKFRVPVYLGNDANLAALGEWKFGAGRGHSNLLYLTISTGIGGGIILENQLINGANGMAGELGHVMAVPDGPMCGCGKPGHLEAVASGTAIARYVKEKLSEGIPSVFTTNSSPTAKEIAAAARDGDKLSNEAFQLAGFYLGRTIADFLHTLNPSILIFGGGVSLSGNLILDPMKASLEKHVISPEYINNLTIVTAALGDDAGLLGALALAQSF
ncbi:MAG: ROK family protein [Anaerolineaceae bacterium]